MGFPFVHLPFLQYLDSSFLAPSDNFFALLFLVASAIFAIIVILGCKRARKKAGGLNRLQLNCWYCCHDQTVLAIFKDGWTCHNCDALNVGFTKEGDYKTVPPEMYEENLNRSQILPRDVVYPGAGYFSIFRETVSPPDILCQSCQVNQTLWFQQLASFVPEDMRNEDRELQSLKRHMDNAYALCSRCKKAVEAELARKNKVIEKISVIKRVTDSVKNNVCKLNTSTQLFRSLIKALKVYRFLSLILLLFIFTEGIYWNVVLTNGAQNMAPPLKRYLLRLIESSQLLEAGISSLALTFLPLDLLLVALKPAIAHLPHSHTPRLFIEAIPLLDMKSEKLSLEKPYLISTLGSVLMLLILELPLIEESLSRPTLTLPPRPSAKVEESVSFPSPSLSRPPSPLTHRSDSTLHHRHPQPFTPPPNPSSHLGVEDKLASISFHDEEYGMDWHT